MTQPSQQGTATARQQVAQLFPDVVVVVFSLYKKSGIIVKII